MRTITWPSRPQQPATTTHSLCRAQPLPHTIRPCESAAPVRVDRVEDTVFPIHHVVAWCVVGGAIWAGVITAGRVAVDVLAHLG